MVTLAYIRTVRYEKAVGNIKDGYDAILRHNLNIPNMHAVSAICPEIMETLALHIRTVMYKRSGLSPVQKEMVATVVSATNKSQF